MTPFGRTITLLCAAVISCAVPVSNKPADVTIIHATVLDVNTGDLLRDHTVTTRDGVITAVAPFGNSDAAGSSIIDAHGRLLTPAFIDAHLHMCSIYPPHCVTPRAPAAPLVMTPDSIAAYRRHMASLYLPYGVTTVRDVGSDERVMPLLLAWMKRSPRAPDYYPVGADLISPNANHIPAPWQVHVADSAAADAKVREYYALGIRNIKLYWRLEESAFRGGLHAAQQLGMNVTAHVDFNVVPVGRALDLGLRNVEHMTSWAFAALKQDVIDSIYQDVARRTRTTDGRYAGYYYLAVPEQWNRMGSDDTTLLALVDKFKSTGASVTPTLHVFAQPLGITWFSVPARDVTEEASRWPKHDLDRAVQGYRVMASYVKRLHDAGVSLNIGTDTPEGGKSVLSEMLLLHDAGISMKGVFRIATLETARGIGHEAEYGSVTPGKRANLILFEGNPLERPRDLLGGKTVFKDGVVLR